MEQPEPAVSVIVPAYRAGGSLTACIDSLMAQDLRERFEVIVVVSGEDEPSLQASGRVELRLVWHPERLSAAHARNIGAAHAVGAALAFTDADVVAPPDWLSTMLSSSDGHTALGGSVANGTRESWIGTAEYLIQFLDLHPARPRRTAWQGATANLFIPRALWDECGPFPEDMEGGEDTLLTASLGERGLFRFVPEAVVKHTNRTRFEDVVRHQIEFGRFTARLARRSTYKLGTLLRYSFLAPVAVAQRIVSLYARVLGWEPTALGRAILSFPLILAGLTAWGIGLFLEGVRLDLRKLTGRRAVKAR